MSFLFLKQITNKKIKVLLFFAFVGGGEAIFPNSTNKDLFILKKDLKKESPNPNFKKSIPPNNFKGEKEDYLLIKPEPLPKGWLKISGEYKYVSLKSAIFWARSKGFDATPPTFSKNRNINFGLQILPTGAKILMSLPQPQHKTGWQMILDYASLRAFSKVGKILSSDYKFYQNIIRFSILVDKMKLYEGEMGYGKSLPSPLKIPIPIIRNPEGIFEVEIKMSNHPSQFFVLYDIRVERTKKVKRDEKGN